MNFEVDKEKSKNKKPYENRSLKLKRRIQKKINEKSTTIILNVKEYFVD